MLTPKRRVLKCVPYYTDVAMTSCHSPQVFKLREKPRCPGILRAEFAGLVETMNG